MKKCNVCGGYYDENKTRYKEKSKRCPSCTFLKGESSKTWYTNSANEKWFNNKEVIDYDDIDNELLDSEIIQYISNYKQRWYWGIIMDYDDYNSQENYLEQSLLEQERSKLINDLFMRIKPRFRDMVFLLFGLAEDRSTYTYEEVAEMFDISITRVHQIEGMVIKELKHPKVTKKFREYLNS